MEGVASSVATARMPGRTARRLLGAVLRLALGAGCAVVGYLLLSAGAAHADNGAGHTDRSSSRVVEVAETARPGKTVKAAVSRTRERVKTVRADHPLKPVTARLTKAVKPVLKPVSRIVEPVLSKPLTRVLKPIVTKPVVTEPPLRPSVTPPVPRPVRPAPPTAVVPDRHKPLKHVPAVSKPAAGTPPAARPAIAVREHAPAPTQCARSAPATPQRGTSASAPGTAPGPWPQPGPAYLGLASSAAAAGADPAPRTPATTSAAWLCPPAPGATSTLDSVHRRGRRPTSAPPPG